MSEQVEDDNKIPVNIITGFLGSGKTTLLNKWVNTSEFKDSLVLINEFGDVGLDHELVQAIDDTVVLLGSGCICCTLQGELIQSLATNIIKSQEGKIPRFKRVLIETTGLADPAGVIGTLNNDDFCLENFYYNGTITVLDGQFVREQIKKQYEAVKQIALADLILISKTDLIDEDELIAINEIAHKINSSAKIHPIIKGNITPKIIEEIGPYKVSDRNNTQKLGAWLNISIPQGTVTSLSQNTTNTSAKAAKKDSTVVLASPLRPASVDFNAAVAKPRIIAHTDIDSFAIVHHEPINALVLLSAINTINQQFGDSVLRVKGILDIEGQKAPVIIHGVQGQLYPISQMDAWPEGEHESKLVFIVRASVLEQIKFIFQQALEHPDTASIAYYQQLINGTIEIGDEGVEEIDLNYAYDDEAERGDFADDFDDYDSDGDGSGFDK